MSLTPALPPSSRCARHPWILALRWAALLLPAGAGLPAQGQEQADSPALPTVEVRGEADVTLPSTHSVTTLTREMIDESSIHEVESLWRQVPGMHVNHYQLGGVANGVVLRGFGGGGHGGDIAVQLDGVTLNEAMSHADGYVDLNLVVPLELEAVTVHHGPTSVLQGNYNRGGLVELRTRRSGQYREVALGAGQHGELDTQAALGLKLGPADELFLAGQHARTDGTRPDSAHRRSTFSARWQRQVNADWRFALSARLHQGQADSPGYLSLSQWALDPQGKDPRVLGDGAHKRYQSLRLEVDRSLGEDTTFMAYAHTTRQDFVRWFTRPQSGDWRQREERYDRRVHGAGASLKGQTKWLNRPLRWMLGADALREATDYGYWDGLQQRQRMATALNDRRATLNNLAAYGQLAWTLHPLVEPTLGLRWDRFSGHCRPLGPEAAPSPCEPMHRVAHLSPKLGLSSQLHPRARLRLNWSEGFALPSAFAKYALGAAGVQPNLFRQTEVGLQWQASRSLWLDVAVYRLDSSQEIRNVAPGMYENDGQTRRRGVEVQALWSPSQALELRWTYGRALSRIRANADAHLIGRQVAAVPRYTSTLQLRWQPVAAWTVEASVREVGRMAVDSANTTWSRPYRLVDLALSHRLAPPTVWGDARLTLSVANLTNRRYASNHTRIGGEELVAPGAPRTWRLGLTAAF